MVRPTNNGSEHFFCASELHKKTALHQGRSRRDGAGGRRRGGSAGVGGGAVVAVLGALRARNLFKWGCYENKVFVMTIRS